MSSYLDLVEEYPKQPEHTLFEKILMAAKRAKDLHNANKTPLVDEPYKAPYLALAEARAGRLELVHREEEPAPMIAAEEDAEEGDDEE